MSEPVTVTFTFGDGAREVGELGEELHHDYTKPGTYVINAIDSEGRSGATTVTVTEAPSPEPDGPAEPTVTVEDVTVQVGGGAPVSYKMTVTNSTGTSTGFELEGTFTADDITPAAIKVEFEGDDNEWVNVPLTQDGSDKVTFSQPGGAFETIGPDFDHYVTLRVSVPDGSPLAAPGTVAGTADLMLDGESVASGSNTVTVEEAALAVAPQVEVNTESSETTDAGG